MDTATTVIIQFAVTRVEPGPQQLSRLGMFGPALEHFVLCSGSGCWRTVCRYSPSGLLKAKALGAAVTEAFCAAREVSCLTHPGQPRSLFVCSKLNGAVSN